MVLATELGKHFEHVNKFISSTRVADEAVLDGSGRSPRQSTISLNNQTNSDNNEDAELRTLVKRVLIKVAGRLIFDRYSQKSICFSLLLLLLLSWTSYNYLMFQTYQTQRDHAKLVLNGPDAFAKSTLSRRPRSRTRACPLSCRLV